MESKKADFLARAKGIPQLWNEVDFLKMGSFSLDLQRTLAEMENAKKSGTLRLLRKESKTFTFTVIFFF